VAYFTNSLICSQLPTRTKRERTNTTLYLRSPELLHEVVCVEDDDKIKKTLQIM